MKDRMGTGLRNPPGVDAEKPENPAPPVVENGRFSKFVFGDDRKEDE